MHPPRHHAVTDESGKGSEREDLKLPDFADPVCPLCGTALRLRPLIVYNPVRLRREQIDELLWCPNVQCDFAYPLTALVRKMLAA